MTMPFATEKWSLELPVNWGFVDNDSGCFTFQAHTPVGALQISSAEKEYENVTESDLFEFAKDRIGEKSFDKVTCGDFSGICVYYSIENVFWMEWWLSAGKTMLYITYNVEEQDKEEERQVVVDILETLTLRSLE